MTTLLAQIAPQQSTQYATLADVLAPHELMLSPLGSQIENLERVTLGGQKYLRFELPAEPDERQLAELSMLATVGTLFVCYERVGKVKGPLLRPLAAHFTPALPPALMHARRYRGKTNEMFTHFMCNLARFSSGVRNHPWSALRVFDPLAGGGTTLFTALVLGASAAGLEHEAHTARSTAAFLKQFMREQGIACREKHERFKGVGRRWVFTIGKEHPQTCLIACGDTADSAALISGFRPHLIVTDLPYGVQHKGQPGTLLSKSLPVWAALLPPGGALVMAWDAKRLPRAEMIALVESASPLVVLNDPPYDSLAHRVDRAIRQRDVLVARPAESLRKERGEGQQ